MYRFHMNFKINKLDKNDEEASIRMVQSDKGRIESSERRVQDVTNFENAISFCGYGRFNIFLFVAAAFGQCAGTVVSVTSSYLIVNAECDLGMTLADKGLLNAITFAGMLSSGLFVGFLSDSFGRKQFLVWGYLLMGLSLAGQAINPTFNVILTLKFFEGFCLTAPHAVCIVYIGELHSNSTRSKVCLCVFSFSGIASGIVALAGLAILPYDWSLEIITDKFVFRSWHLFLLVNSLFAFVASILFCFLPESPKFLLAQRRHEEALAILRKIYSINTGKNPDTYPIEKLYFDDNSIIPLDKIMIIIKDGIKKSAPLFTNKKYIIRLIHLCVMYTCVMISFNVFRLWYPQLSTIFEDYKNTHNETTQMCTMINAYLDKIAATSSNSTGVAECTTIISGPETYIRTSIIGFLNVVTTFSAIFVIDRIDKRFIIFIVVGIAGILAATLFLVKSTMVIFIFFAIFVPTIYIPINLIVTITVDSFPTEFRAFTLTIQIWIARCGTVSGNILFPYLLESGCLTPFILIASLCFCTAILSLFLPKDKNITTK